MKRHSHTVGYALLAVVSLYGLPVQPAMPGEVPNLAASATITASSEYSVQYRACFVADGRVPASESHSDLSAAWCVHKETSGDRGEIVFQWNEPVTISTILYWGRTGWFLSECWKDFAVYADDDVAPRVTGTFPMRHGPQPIAVPRLQVRKLTLRFLNSHGGPNPGASEIQIFEAPPDDPAIVGYLAKVARHASLAIMPWVEESNPADVARLIAQLRELGGGYHQADADAATLERLVSANAQAERSPSDFQSALESLERQVLLFDVDRVAVIRRHEINASHVYTYHYEGFQPGGGLAVVSLQHPETDPVELVASPTGQILDLDLSPDGRTLLFSWRRAEDEGYHLWTIGVDGSNLRQLTDGPWHDYNACWLPDGDIALLSTRAPQFAYCWHAPVGVLHRMKADGTGLRRLSANYLNDFTPALLDDGRILYTRWEYVDRPAIPIQSLWTIHPDGTALAGCFGNRVLSPGTFMEARPIPGTQKIVCTMTGHNGPTRGALGVIDRTRGVNAQEAIENITPDVPVPAVNEGDGNTAGSKQYSSPMPLDSVRLLCSIQGPLLVRTFDGRCQSVALDAPEGGMQWFDATPIRPRTPPPVVPSALPDRSDGLATVFLQDVSRGLAPHVARGEVKRIRVVREMEKTVRIDPGLRAFGFQFPVISCGATYAGKDVLGEVPVEPDGSACFRVPAGMPVYFMALDAQGRAVQRMRSFTHFMPGESQGCIGCHEHRLGASPPKVGSAYFQGEPRDLEPPEWGRGGFDYARFVQPVLDRYCGDCHGGTEPAGRIDLAGDRTDFFSVSYETLARDDQGPSGSRYVSWIPTYNGQEQNILNVAPKTWGSPASRLAELILSGHPDADGKARFAMDDASRRRVLAWIDLNVPYYGTSETAYPDRPGCRQLYPADLERVLADVAARRCAECHAQGKIPRREWVRIERAAWNAFLLAPLSRTAGGTQRCGRAVFADTADADYRAILSAFEPITALIRETPRMDMPGAKPAACVSRSCQ